MTDCLVTTLKGAVDDNYIKRLNTLTVVLPKTGNSTYVAGSIAVDFKVVSGTVRFVANGVDKTLSAGETLNNISATMTAMSDNCFVCVSPKSVLTQIEQALSTGSLIADFESIAGLNYLSSGGNIELNLDKFKAVGIQTLNVSAYTEEKARSVYGDISSLASFNGGSSLGFDAYNGLSFNIYGDVSLLPFDRIRLIGDKVCYGNLAKLPRCKYFLASSSSWRKYQWDASGGTTNPNIVVMAFVNLGTMLDQMLVDQAGRTFSPFASGGDYATMNVGGTHTMEPSVYEAAIAALQEKGVTVSITIME